MEKKYKLIQNVITPELSFYKGDIRTEQEWLEAKLIYFIKCCDNPNWFEEIKDHKEGCEYEHFKSLGSKRFNILGEFLNIDYCPCCGVKL